MVTIYWRDIPSQVLVQVGRTKAKVQLPQRFQEAIDRAAMRAGKGSSDLYLEEWRRETCHRSLGQSTRHLSAVDRSCSLTAEQQQAWLCFDGLRPHFSEPYKGERYSIVERSAKGFSDR